MSDIGTITIGGLALIGVFSVLHHLRFAVIYKLTWAICAAIGAVVVYKVLKGESVDSAARDIKNQVGGKARELKGQAQGVWKGA